MKRFVMFLIANGLLFGLVGFVQKFQTITSSGVAIAKENSQTSNAVSGGVDDAAAVLKTYVEAHSSMARHAKMRLGAGLGVEPGNVIAQSSRASKMVVAENTTAAELGVPSSAEEANSGQADDLLLTNGKEKRSKSGEKKSGTPSVKSTGSEKPAAAGSSTESAEESVEAEAEEPAAGSSGGETAGESLESEAVIPVAGDTTPESSGEDTNAKADDNEVDGDEDENKTASAAEDHLKLFVENKFPSAATCGTCHPKHYKEWSVSQHAYAQLSPIYLSLNNRINQLSNGSNGDFCLRCHSPVGANLGESPFMSNLDRHPTSREGITCVVCHRIDKAYNKASGRLALVEGGLTDPIFGPNGNVGVKEVLDKPEKFRVVTKEEDRGRKIHSSAKLFTSIKTPVFCGSCHDVTLFNGFRLEEAYSEYRLSPAAAKGITCQDCHMGKIQGKVSGYARGPAAIVGDEPTTPRKLTSHLFSGPDPSVLHPGLFPHNEKAAAFKTQREWLQYKHEEGWGTDEFEDNIPKGYKFPKTWESVDDRYDAREILNKQFQLLEFARIKRLEVMRNGFELGKIITDRADSGGLAFRVQVRNATDGHNVPTGFTGERLVWLDVTVKDRNGAVVYRSGDRDPNGDLRDGHSSYVHAGKIERDRDLFSLQSIFVTQNGRGGEIEHVIPIPFPLFALPRVLPSTTSLVFTGEPATERVHKKGIEPNGERWGSYKISSSQLTGAGPYTASIKLLAQAAPVNLIIASQNVGYDYGMTPGEIGRALVASTMELWTREITLGVGPRRDTPPSLGLGAGTGLAPAPAGKKELLPWQKGAFVDE